MSFGLLIAYLLPGVTALLGVSYFSTTVYVWLGTASSSSPTVGGFLYVTLASVWSGLIVHTVRWFIVDRIHRCTGLQEPPWDHARIEEHFRAYYWLEYKHYRFYQFYSNSLVSIVFLALCRRASAGLWSPVSWIDVGLLLLSALFFLGSRDTLDNYYRRVNDILGAKSA